MTQRVSVPETAPRESAGTRAERLGHDRLRAALPAENALFPNIAWVIRERGAALCDSIRRFKGLERPVIVLLELPEEDPAKLDRLLYVGASRARQHLVVIAPATVLGRLS